MPQVTGSSGYDDPFLYLGKLFIHFAYHKIAKCVNGFFFTFYLCTFLAEICFIVDNFSIDMIRTYGPFLLMFAYMLVAMVFTMLMEDTILKIVDEMNSSFWSTESVGPGVQQFIKKKSIQTTYFYFSVYAVVLLCSSSFFPIFGDHREWNIFEVVSDQYLGVWSKIFNQLFFWSTPVITYATLRLTGALVYGIERLSLQTFLINQQIFQISDDHPDCDKLKIGEKILWQNKIFHTLLSCIKHHIFIVTLCKKLLGSVKLAFITLLITGALASIALVFFFMNIFENASTIMKLRVAAMSIGTTIIVVFNCQAGQKISDQMEGIFDTLTQCSWYNWDAKSKQVLLIFMKNSLKPYSLGFAGYVANYQLAVSVMRTSFSYGVVLYHLGILSDNSD